METAPKKLEQDRVEIEQSHLPAPVVSYMPVEDCWRLDQAYGYDDNGTLITVPAGFMFDLASVPRPFWWLIAPFELSITAPLLHDFLYANAGAPPTDMITPYRTYSRKQVDTIFTEIMRLEGVVGWRRKLAYWAVRWFGGGVWGLKQSHNPNN